ncbi:hypothetical protein GDO78_000478 [Eleutherodactylus coqui]|uniref:HEPN domain-containing protein n=1 Tax=Eleutherodactylus coqui TaxID=57060 RepID=A0A8J6FSN0_ELECQ|nr:hypothetical protein GDO78_000478 [Eleutherodactylus coqui]
MIQIFNIALVFLYKYLGPALYVYNNAVFTPEDWHGIQEIARSRKKDDPLKVGRFGIGFNSVYHITDVPSIFSGDQIGMLDPHQVLFGRHESGQCWNIKEDSKEISELVDQFAPYIDIFGSTKETLAEGYYPGTFFRFPLRVQPSLLSNNLYNKEKVLELYESFRADADTVLLFLKNVQKVSLHIREADGSEKLVFRVTASENKLLKHDRPNSIKILGTAIDNYCKGVPSNSITCVTYHANIVVEDESVKETQTSSWLVCNSVGGRGICTELDSLADDLKFVPTIGIAMPLWHNGDVKGAESQFVGRAFCFLPLPPGDESKTGLPVHISGFFGLTDNRRSIKWRELDQWRDPAALWNELLVKNVVPKTYATLILEAIKRMETEENPDFPLSADSIYHVWPEVDQVRTHWKPIIEPLLKELFQNPVIYSAKKCWLKESDVNFTEIDEHQEYTKTILIYLQNSGTQIAKVPANVAAAFQIPINNSKPVKKVTPSLVRQVLRKCGHRGPAHEKLHILEFILGDENYSDLIGLEILPLQNGSFISFSSSVSDKDVIYITSEEYPRALFPGLEGRLLSEDLKPKILTALKEAATSRGRPCTQLQLLNPERFIRLTKEIMNTTWPTRDLVVKWFPGKHKQHPPISWLKMIWKMLYIHFPEDLTCLDDMPLIPTKPLEEDEEEESILEVIRLRTPSPVIYDDVTDTQLPEHLPEIIKNLGGIVLTCLDPAIQHPLIKNYVYPPTPSALLHIMARMSLQKLSNQIASLTPVLKEALRRFLASLTDINEKEKKIIQELMVFKRIEQTSEEKNSFVSLRGCKVLHHNAKLPPKTRLSFPVIDSSDEETIRLTKMLKVEQLKSTDCLKTILQDVEKGFYSVEERTNVMLWVLENLTFLKNENHAAINWLSSLKFIPIYRDRLVSASELFDPEIDILQNLFCAEEQHYFPPAIFTSSDVLHSLRQIGLKNDSHILEKDIVQIAKKIEALYNGSGKNNEVVVKKAKTLLSVLKKNYKLVQSPEGKAILKKIKWIPAIKERPPNYPNSLVWIGDQFKLFAPGEMCNVSYAVLVGSSVPLVEIMHDNIDKVLGILKEPSIEAVLKHLKVVVDWYNSKTITDEDYYQFQHILLEIYGFMQECLDKGKELYKSLSFPWIWTGKTFCSPRQAIIMSPYSLDLQPFLHKIPNTMVKFDKLFKFCGSIEQLTPGQIFDVVNIIYERSKQPMDKEENKQNINIMLNIVRWIPIHECCYCDIKVDDLNDLLEDSVEPIILVHEDIPMKTAEWLNSGQREPLTLLQNADDASATECNFMIDMRRNMDIRENLLDPGMAAYFLNITRLGESLKRKFMIMFDPNINHISKHIRDKSNPGIKINWSKQQKRLRKFPNQFKPFLSIFNCNLPLAVEAPYCYKDIYTLVDEFSLCGYRLILFTQNVNSMVLKYLKPEETEPKLAQDTAAKVIHNCISTKKYPTEMPKSSYILQIAVQEFHHVFRRIVDLHSPLFRGPEDEPANIFEMAKTGQTKRMTEELPQKTVDSTTWLICSCMDINDALKFALSDSGKRLGLVPCGGVAVMLSESQDGKWRVKPFSGNVGEVFCYLPLRIKTGLPLHINGCFAVTSNRKEIWKTDTKGRDMSTSGELMNYNYSSIWPDPDCVHDDFSVICQGLYEDIAKGKGKDRMKVFSDGTSWVSMKNIFMKYLKKTGSKNLCAVELPSWVKLGFEEAGSEIQPELRDPLMLFVLNERIQAFSEILQVTPCIPCSSDNHPLVVPSRLIHPEGRNYLNPVVLVKLVQLGMMKDDILWEDLIERIESIALINKVDHAAACLRSNIILSLIDEKLKFRDPKSKEFSGFSLHWKGSDFKRCGPISLAVKEYLGLLKKPSPELVIDQLKEVAKYTDGNTLYQENITNACYKFLNEAILLNEATKTMIVTELKEFPLIYVEGIYVTSEKMPNKYKNNFRELFESVGVKSAFIVEDFASVLEMVKSANSNKKISENDFQLCRRIISEGIWGLIREKSQEFSKSLCYNDCPWIKVKDTAVKYCHSDIPREVAVKLGSVPKRHKALERYATNICFTSLGTEFGQKEKLTSRIKSILNAYPSEKEINHSCDRIFDEKWTPLQGPALCVYNNQPFTDDDIRGIQNLGKGTKEGNPCKTGQICIFDPHARYAPGATSLSPGRMFRDLDADFRTQFSDVLNLYLGDHFNLSSATIMVQNLLDKLRTDGAELLMFLNHIEKISICEIEKTTGDLKVLYSVQGKITEGDRLKRKQFHSSITYTMDIEDTEGNLTTWLICNRSGYSNMGKVLKSVVSAHKNQDITLFPRGLPFHVNGHFALDSARRNLWRDDDGVGVRSDWNNSLMTALVAPAYVELLVQLKKRYFTGTDPTISVLHNILDLQPDWYCLVKAVYACIYEDSKRLLPVVRAPNVDGSDMQSAVIITWVNMSALHHMKNMEYNITTRKTVAENVYRLKHLLLEIGFNLVYYSDETANLYHCLVDAGIPVAYATPSDVRHFLMTFSSPDTSCHIGKLPCRLQQTNLKLFHSLKLLVDYCLKDAEENEIQIEDLFMNTLYLSFADLLSSVLPREYKTKVFVPWKDSFASESWLKSAWHFISESFNVKDDQTDATTFDTVLETLKDWALLPGIKFTVSPGQLIIPDGDVLLPFSLMHIAIFPNAQSDKVFHTLMKTGCIQLALNKICSKDNILLPLLAGHTANIDNPMSILRAIHHMIQTSTFRTEKIAENDFDALLMYFNCNLDHLSSEDATNILRLLPCYRSASGRYITLSKYGTCYVLTKSIPAIEVEKWSHSSSFAFLEEKIHLKELYTALGCVPVDDLEIYSKHLLPKFENLSYNAKLEHLIYLKNYLCGLEESSTLKEQIFAKLEDLAFIHDASGRLKPAKHFYDRTVRVFEVMLSEKLFIPLEFFKKLEQITKPKNQSAFFLSWIKFLRNIGLKHVISQQQLLQFAKEISMRANAESWTKEALQNTVDVILYHVFQERTDLFSANFLKELSMVPFLCPERAPAELIRFHPQYQEVNGTLPLIRFNGAQVNPKFKQTDVMQLLWTSCPILPEKATPLTIKEQEGSTLGPQEQLEQVLTMLNVNLDPSLDKVINNCRNICNITTVDDEIVKTRVKVLRSIYEFLSTEKKEFKFQLRGVSFVMVEDGWKLLKPEEVVINLEFESDFKPYLYKLPLELGTFHQLFKNLGTEDIVSTKQYVEVLSRIFKISEGKQLDPNEMRTVKRVVSGLLKSLQNDSAKVRNDLENIRDLALYLPSQDGRLVKSSILVFDDAPHYKSRIQGNIGVQMLVDLSQCYMGKDHGFHTRIIMLLPQKLRPRLLSSILEEQLDEETPKSCQFGTLCSLQGRLQLLLSSEQFITGLIRIMKHENDNAFLANEEKAIKLCKALREGLKVSCFEKLQTTLRVKGFNPIPHSRSETLAFLKRYGHAVILLYIQHSDSRDINFLLALAMTLKSATDNLISDTSYLIAMLGCNDIYRINEKLDSLGVKYDSSTEQSKLELPMPGTPIPAEIHYTLLMDPTNVFYPGEYVGYLVDAEGGDSFGSYQPTYTYAIIVQEVEKDDGNSSSLGKFYQIDIGYSEYKIVSSLDLYKFSRPEDTAQNKDSAPSTPTSPTEFPPPGPRTPPSFPNKESNKTSSTKHQSPKKMKLHSLPEILKEVTAVIEQAWKLAESERKKIIRRLYLKWHPDKNAENLDIATEVFKHLQNEINRLEKQAFVDVNVERTTRRTFTTPSSRFQSEKSSFQRFYSSWNQEATNHKSERQQYKEKFSVPTGSYDSKRFFVPPTFKSVGNPVEARRWLRQARANFSAARNDMHKNANEWVCFKCYLSTKLALIAADYAVRGKSDKDLEGLTKDVQTLEAYGVDSLKTRYPDMLPFPQIPNDRFTSDVAMRVMECTACIIIKLENFIQNKII